MYVFAEVSFHILVRIGRFHRIDGSHQTSVLVDRITVHDNILHDGTQFLVTTGLQPTADTTCIKITYSQFLVVEQQRYQFVDIVCHQIAFRIDNETLIFQERRREVNRRRSAEEPFLHLIISPTFGGVHDSQSLNEQPDPLWQFVDMRNTAFILLTHHHPFVGTHRRLSQPQCHQGDTQ